MQEYILDSNIVIYFIKNEPKIVELLKKLGREYFFISIITRIEVLAGAKTEAELKLLNKILRTFYPIDLRTEIADAAVHFEKQHPKKLKFKDLIIAATAQTEGLTLITADKDFKKIKSLKLKLVQLHLK